MRPHPANRFSKSSPCGFIPAKTPLARALMPRQAYSAAVKSDGRSGYIPCPLRGKGLGKSGGALLTKEGRGGWEKCQAYSEAVKSDREERFPLFP